MMRFMAAVSTLDIGLWSRDNHRKSSTCLRSDTRGGQIFSRLMTILVAEDDPASGRIIEVTLRRCAHAVALVRNGREALDALGKGPVDAVITDWMMPELDGIELVRNIRRLPKPHPILVVLTSLRSDEARLHALQSGADEFLCKPLRPVELLERLNSGLARRQSTLVVPASAPAPGPAALPSVLPSVLPALAAPVRVSAAPAPERPARAGTGTPPGAMGPFFVVGIAASTGGPLALKAFVESRALSRGTAYLIVLHGPDWVQRHMVNSLGSVTDLPVVIAVHGETIEPGKVYLSPGDRHLCVAEGGRRIEIRNSPEINYVRPSADPLFQTLAEGFGASTIGVVLTGLGADGAQGAQAIVARGGRVFVQDPATAVAESMPRATLSLLGTQCVVESIPDLAKSVGRAVESRLPAGDVYA